jgi:hypothetical protein
VTQNLDLFCPQSDTRSGFLRQRVLFLALPSAAVHKTLLVFISRNSIFVISDLRRELHENCALQGHYAASSRYFSPTFRTNYRSHLQASTPEYLTDRLTLNVGNKLPLFAALNETDRSPQIVLRPLNLPLERTAFTDAFASFLICTPGGADVIILSLIQHAV